MSIAEKLKSLGVELPQPVKPVANYVPWVKSGNLVFISGQLPLVHGKIGCTGHLGNNASIEQGAAEARQCAINLIAQMRDACDGDLNKVKRIVKITGFVASTTGFADHASVMNGASNFFVDVFGEIGRHARSSVGMASLPLNTLVEIEAIIEVA